LTQKRTSSIAEYESDRKAKKTAEKQIGRSDDTVQKTGKAAYEERKARQREERKLKNRISKREKEIATLEAEQEKLNTEIAAMADDRTGSLEKAYAFEKVQKSLKEAMDDWGDATEALELLGTTD